MAWKWKVLGFGAAFVLLGVVLALAVAAHAKREAPRGVVVSTTVLECATRELLGKESGIPVVSLIPGGSCPGHFDVSPSVAERVRTARLVLVHDYQAALLKQLRGLAPEAQIRSIETRGSVVIPGNYLRLAQHAADALADACPERRNIILANAAEMAGRAAMRTRETLKRTEAWEGQPVVASAMQREFCEWLKLKPVGELARPEDVTPGEFEALLRSKPTAVVGNLQEGTSAAEALASRLGVPLVVLSNFPSAAGFGEGYEALLAENVRRVESACRKR